MDPLKVVLFNTLVCLSLLIAIFSKMVVSLLISLLFMILFPLFRGFASGLSYFKLPYIYDSDICPFKRAFLLYFEGYFICLEVCF